MPKQPSSKKSEPRKSEAKKSRAGVGGPKTVEGKNVARFNALKHGLKAGQLVLLLPDETAEEYEALRAGWLEEFSPDTPAEKLLVDELIRTHWLFQRAQRRLMETERAIAGDENTHPADWTAEDEHRIELLQRYKASHERSYYRALNAVRQWCRDRIYLAREQREQERERDKLEEEKQKLLNELERRERERATRRGERREESDFEEGGSEAQLGQRLFRVRGEDETGKLERSESGEELLRDSRRSLIESDTR